MYTEYYINSIDEKDLDIKNNVDQVARFPISAISAPIQQIKLIRKMVTGISLGCLVDYPLANSELNRRQDLIGDAIKVGIDFISIPIPFYHIINRKYDKFREDILKNTTLCKENGVELRYILEYRKFDHLLLNKICDILIKSSINTIYPSTGFFIDSIEDNTIACAYLKEKTGIQTVVNGNIWKKSQIKSLINVNPYGFSSNNIFSFSLLDRELYDRKR